MTMLSDAAPTATLQTSEDRLPILLSRGRPRDWLLGITCFSCFNKASLALTPSSFRSFFRELANLSLVFCTRLGFAGRGFLVAAS